MTNELIYPIVNLRSCLFISFFFEYTGKAEPLEDEKEMGMFRRILEMREKLEGIIQLQTIKYQRSGIPSCRKNSEKEIG